MSGLLVKTVFLRCILPILLLAACILRPSLISLIYGLLCLGAFIVPLPYSSRIAIPAVTKLYLLVVLIISAIFCLAIIIFNIVLISAKDVAALVQPPCNASTSAVLQFIGLDHLEGAPVASIIRIVLPEPLAILGAIITYVVVVVFGRTSATDQVSPALPVHHHQELPSPGDQHESFTQNQPGIETDAIAADRKASTSVTDHLINCLRLLVRTSEIIWMVLLCLSGIIWPCLISAIYFLTFLGIMTYWGCYKRWKGNRARPIKILMLLVATCQLILIYLFQIPLIQQKLNFETLVARLLGIRRLVYVNCSDATTLLMPPEALWPDYVNPAFLFVFFFYTSCQIRWASWVVSSQKEAARARSRLSGGRATADQQGLMDSDDELVYSAGDSDSGGSRSGSRQHLGPHVAKPRSTGASLTRGFSLGTSPVDEHENQRLGLVFATIIRHSYALALITMMAWAVTYHSWLTLVFLLMACILWMVPDTRNACLVASPFIVFYAECLLIIQYIFCLKLTDQELPRGIPGGMPFDQIGLLKPRNVSRCIPLIVEVAYSIPFWLMMRLFFRDRYFLKYGPPAPSKYGTFPSVESGHRKRGASITWPNLDGKSTSYLFNFLVKYWIYVCALVILLVSIRSPVVAYGIVYMLFFILLVTLVNISWAFTRRFLIVYWFIVALFSIMVLLAVYMYQFPQVPQWWQNATHLSTDVNDSLGLVAYSIKDLFIRLITPISFLIVVVLQLKFFHKSFMRLTDIRPQRRISTAAEEPYVQRVEMAEDNVWYKRWFRTVQLWYKRSANVIWRFLEVFWPKLLAFAFMMLAAYQPCAVHFPLVVLVVVMVLIRWFHGFITVIGCLWVAAVVVTKMLFQMPFVPATFASGKNCTHALEEEKARLESQNSSRVSQYDSAAAWAGFEKNPHTALHLSGHVIVLVIIGLQAVVFLRQRYYRVVEGGATLPHGITFGGITRSNADVGLPQMLMYLVNFVFYKFGVEITFIVTVIAISVRMDAIAVIYALWILVLIFLKRHHLRRVWPIFALFLVIILPLQYASAVGLPPTECIPYPWPDGHFNRDLVVWLYLPDYMYPPNAKYLIADFFMVLCACSQLYVFHYEGESDPIYDGGDNSQIIYHPKYEDLPNPVDDFITYTKTALDSIKVFVFEYFHWITLIMVFVAGVGGISLFALGYLLACFLLLWKGNEVFLQPIKRVCRFWFALLFYSALIILFKTSLQVVGCAYAETLREHFCWLIQLFSIVCLNDRFDTDSECSASKNEADIHYDAAVFALVLFQLRIFSSHYFRHVVWEFRAQKLLASCGAGLINALMKREIRGQIEKEAATLQKIHDQIVQIKRSRQEVDEKAGIVDPGGSKMYAGTKRGGDYYMFKHESKQAREVKDTELEPPSTGIAPEVDQPEEKTAGPLQLVAAAVDQDFDVNKAKRETQLSLDSTPGTSVGEEVPDKPGGILGKIKGILLYLWGILESVFKLATRWFNKWSRNYRYVAFLLDKEKLRIKQGELTPPPSCPMPEELTVEEGTTSSSRHESRRSTTIGFEQPTDEMLSSITETVDLDFAKRNVFVRFGKATYYLALSKTEVLCYILMIVNHMRNASILSMFFPLMAFLWGTLCAPRPPKIFWVTVITYTEAIVVLKFLFQFQFFPWNTKVVLDSDAFYPPRIIGVERRDGFAFWDIVLLMVLFYHRYILRVLGLWKDVEWVDDDIRQLEAEQMAKFDEGEGGLSGEQMLKQDAIQLHEVRKSGSLDDESGAGVTAPDGVPRVSSQSVAVSGPYSGYCGYCVNFFHRLLEPLRWYLQDLYTLMFLCDSICFIILVFGYSSFGTAQGNVGNVLSVIKDNKVPLPFILLLLAQFTLVVIDRALYLRHSQTGRVLYHFLLVVLIHILMFFILPKVTDQSFNRNIPAQLWYFVKCIYFLYSAWQIRSGYPNRTLGNFLTKHYNMVNYVLFKVFMAVPFLFELRTIMDWIWTDTCMPMFDYIKMENIYSYAYSTKCSRKMEKDYPFPVGVRRGAVVKYGMGLTLLILIILVLWLPLLLFSLLNTIGQENPPSLCRLTFGIDGYPSFYEGISQGNFLRELTMDELTVLNTAFSKSKTALAFLSEYSRSDIYKVDFPYDSYHTWDISPPTLKSLEKELKTAEKLSLNLYWEFRRPARGASSPVLLSNSRIVPLAKDNPIRTSLSQLITNQSAADVVIPHLYFPFVEVPPSGGAKMSPSLIYGACEEYGCPTSALDAYLNFTMSRISQGSMTWWNASILVPGWIRGITKGPAAQEEVRKSPYIYAFVSKVFPTVLNSITSGGIIGVYVVVVLAVGRLIRSIVMGSLSDIMWDEVPNIDYVLKLCLNIFLVREAKDFETELVLFSKLLFLFRSPTTMIEMTRPKLD